MADYAPPREILERYARVLVHFGVRAQPGDTTLLYGHEDTKPLFFAACREIWDSGGNVIQMFLPADDAEHNFDAAYFAVASDAQLTHFPEAYWRGLWESVDHIIFLKGDRDPRSAAGIDPARRALQAPALQRYWVIRKAQERAGRLNWTLASYPTPAMAAEAGLSLEAYWEQVISACHLGDPDPVTRWQETQREVDRYRDWLNGLGIRRLHVEAEGTDLWVSVGEQRRWLSGGGLNVPSFEIFTSPDWRGTEGTVRFSEPLYRDGTLIRGIELEFRAGEIVRADAAENAAMLKEMVAQPGANRVGEFSLTDARLSPITRFMADTLYDENRGGRYGNTHLAIGFAITEAYDGDEATVSDAEWERLGFNTDSALHCDIISTTDRTVTATLADGSKRVIYADGRFQAD